MNARFFRVASHHGVTMIELLVAVAISSLAVSVIFFSWTYMNRHMASSEQRALLQRETSRIVELVSGKVRTSAGLLRWEEQSLELVSGDEDTVRFAFDGTTLMQDTLPVTVADRRVRVVGFTVSDANEGTLTGSRHILLQIEVALEDQMGRRFSQSRSVKTQLLPHGDTDPQWSF